MIKPDVIVCWPRNADYPLWRQFIRDNRDRFNLIIIAFTETHQGQDYRAFVRHAMQKDYVLFVDGAEPRGRDEDWRDLAIHQALVHSYNAEWIWFTEQDFLVKEGFWEELEQAEKTGAEVLATYDSDRMHPCNIFIKRPALEKTRKRFGIVPDISDHFSMFQKELEQSGVKIYIFNPEHYEHLNGLSHNLTLIYNDQMPVWQVERFNQYLKDSLKVTVPLDLRYMSLLASYFTKIIV